MVKPVYNSVRTGFLSGLLLPVISLMIFYLNRYSSIPFIEFARFVWFRDILSPLLSLNVLPNLVLFFIFVRKDLMLSARGVLLATFIMAGAVLLAKVIS